MAKMSLEGLRELREAKKNELRKRDPVGKEIQVIVGMGTCGIAAGGKRTLEAFLDAVDGKKLVDSVVVRQIGCMGMCGSEPTVEVLVPGMPNTFYGGVTSAEIAMEIVEKHIIGRKLVDGRILSPPAAGTKNT